jgi:hypothetical protein
MYVAQRPWRPGLRAVRLRFSTIQQIFGLGISKNSSRANFQQQGFP